MSTKKKTDFEKKAEAEREKFADFLERATVISTTQRGLHNSTNRDEGHVEAPSSADPKVWAAWRAAHPKKGTE